MSKKKIATVVKIWKDEPRAGTKIIADGFNREHEYVLRLVQKHESHFLEFEINTPFLERSIPRQRVNTNKRGQPVNEYLLNEDQALFLGTLLRNSPKVIEFKKRLIKEFRKVRNQLQNLKAHHQDPEYIEARARGKMIRRDATAAMKEFIDYAESQGSTHAAKYYMIYTNMMNSCLFIVQGSFKNLREVMNIDQLMVVATVEKIMDNALREAMQENMYYKDIFQHVKKKILQFAEMYGKTEIISKQLTQQKVLNM